MSLYVGESLSIPELEEQFTLGFTVVGGVGTVQWKWYINTAGMVN